MVADAMAPYLARSSAALGLTLQDKQAQRWVGGGVGVGVGGVGVGVGGVGGGGLKLCS